MAVLDGEIAQDRPVFTQKQIDNQPALVEPQVFGTVGDPFTDQRPRAVAADHVTRRQRMLPLILAVSDRGELLTLIDRHRIRTHEHVDVRHGVQTIAQDCLQVGLVEAVAGVPPLGPDLLRTGPVENQPAVGIDEPHAGIDPGHRGDPIRDADGLEDAHHLAVEVDGTWQAVDVCRAFQDHDPQPAQP